MNYEVNQHSLGANLPGQSNIGLYVGGAVSAGLAKVNGGGNAYLSGPVTGSIQFNGGGSLLGPAVSTVFADQYLYSLNQSQAVRNVVQKATISITDVNNINLDVSTNTLNGNRRVYKIDASKLSTLSTFNVSGMTADDTLIIDVIGATVNWGWQVNAAYKNRIVWNFRDATNILVQQRSFTGAMLAPLAALDQRNNIQGNVIVSSWTNVGAPELHFGNQFRFEGDLHEPVPEPASVAALLVGLGAVARKRRR